MANQNSEIKTTSSPDRRKATRFNPELLTAILTDQGKIDASSYSKIATATQNQEPDRVSRLSVNAFKEELKKLLEKSYEKIAATSEKDKLLKDFNHIHNNLKPFLKKLIDEKPVSYKDEKTGADYYDCIKILYSSGLTKLASLSLKESQGFAETSHIFLELIAQENDGVCKYFLMTSAKESFSYVWGSSLRPIKEKIDSSNHIYYAQELAKAIKEATNFIDSNKSNPFIELHLQSLIDDAMFTCVRVGAEKFVELLRSFNGNQYEAKKIFAVSNQVIDTLKTCYSYRSDSSQYRLNVLVQQIKWIKAEVLLTEAYKNNVVREKVSLTRASLTQLMEENKANLTSGTIDFKKMESDYSKFMEQLFSKKQERIGDLVAEYFADFNTRPVVQLS